MQTIIRVQKNLNADPFARIDKVPLNDPKISYKAKGLLSYVLSKPDGWETNYTDLANHSTDGIKAIRSGITELINNKYCRRVKVINPESKRILKWVLIFYERPYKGALKTIITVPALKPHTQKGYLDIEPDACFPHVEKLHVEKLHVENDTLLTNVFKQQNTVLTTDINNNNKAAQADSAGSAAVEIPKKNKKEFNNLLKEIELLGWAGPVNEIAAAYMEDKELVLSWLEKTKETKGINNPAGFFRRGIQSKTKPKTKVEIEKNKFSLDPFADFYEN